MKKTGKTKMMRCVAELPWIENRNSRAEGEGVAIACRNLHPARGKKGVLVPVDDFGRVSAGVGKLLLTFDWAGVGECVLMARGGELRAVVIEPGELRGEMVLIGRLPKSPTVAIAETSQEITLMTTDAAYRLRMPTSGGIEGTWKLGRVAEDYPALRFGIVATTEMSGTIAERTLTGSYGTTTHRLNGEDEERLGADAKKAYYEIERGSRGLGYAMQPMLMRYVLKDDAGRTLHESGITLVETESGFQLTGRQKVDLTQGKRGGTTLTATCFLAGIGLGGEDADEETKRRVASVEIYSSGAIHPLDAEEGSVATRVNGGQEAEFCLPGMAMGAGLTEARGRRGEIVEGLAARAEKSLKRVATIAYPYMNLSRGSLQTIGGAAGGEGSSQAIVERQTRILSTETAEPDAEETLRARCSMPHTFTATSAAKAGSTVLWGNPKGRLYAGYHPSTLAAKMNGAKVTVAVEVELTGGNGEPAGKVMRQEEIAAGREMTLWPRLSYPDRRATKMTVTVSNVAGEGVKRLEVALKPVAGRNEAAYLSPDQRPIELENDPTGVQPQEAESPEEELTGMVVATESGRLQEAKSVTDCGCGKIMAITASTPSSSSWDWGRDRFYVMAQGGIVSVASSQKGARVTMQPLDRRGVKSGSHVSPTSRSETGVAAIAGGELVTISGVRVKTWGPVPADATALGWDGKDEDLWIVRENGHTQLRPISEPERQYERDTPEIDSLLSDGNRMLIITKDHNLLDSKERSVEPKDVEWTVRIGIGSGSYPRVRGTVGALRRVTAIGLAMIASVIEARFTASTDNGAGSHWMRLLVGAMLSGALRAPIQLPVAAPLRGYMTMTIKGHVAGDAEIAGVTVEMR